MPTPLIKKYAQKTGKTEAQVEKLWDDAKKAADGRKMDPKSRIYWGFVNSTLQKNLGLREAMPTFKEYIELELEPAEAEAGWTPPLEAVVPAAVELPPAELPLAAPLPPESSPDCLVNCLFAARDVAHSLHLSVRSYAQHMALQELYEALLDAADEIAEGIRGKYGMQDPMVPKLEHFTQFLHSDAAVSGFIGELARWIEQDAPKCVKPVDEFIINKLADLTMVVYRIKYKLEHLQ